MNKFKYFLYDNVDKRFIEIYDGFVCGRLEGDCLFKDDLVSRKQCQFTIAGNDIYIEDLNSRNKTRINNVPLRPGKKRRIQLNDVVEFGVQRLILTNQDKHIPANIEDVPLNQEIYKGVILDDGRLSASSANDSITKKTLVLLDRFTFQKLRLRDTFFPPRPRFVVKPESLPEAKPQRERRTIRIEMHKEQTSIYLLMNLAAAWVMLWIVLYKEGGIDSAMVGKLAMISGVSTLLGAGTYYLIMQGRPVSPLTKLPAFLLWFVGTVFASFMAAKQTSILTRSVENLVNQHCFKSFSSDACKQYSSPTLLKIAGVSGTLQEQAEARMTVEQQNRMPAAVTENVTPVIKPSAKPVKSTRVKLKPKAAQPAKNQRK